MKRKMNAAKKMLFLLGLLVLAMTAAMSVSASAAGLKKVGSKYIYEVNGKRVKNKWKTVKKVEVTNIYGTTRTKVKYYFRKNGYAATKSYKIGKVYYVFNKEGQLLNSKVTGETMNTIQEIGGVKYGVNKNGKALTGYQVAGTILDGNSLYMFNKNGKVNKGRSAALKAAIDAQDLAALKKLVGEPKNVIKSDLDSCAGIPGSTELVSGKDIQLIYDTFKVNVFEVTETGAQYVQSVEQK